MMFRGLTIFSFVSAVRGDDEQASLLQTASRDHAHLMARRANTISDFERELDGALAMKGGCSKALAEKTTTKTKYEAEALVKEWKDTFNYKRKVKNDVKAAAYCSTIVDGHATLKDDDFKEGKCKTAKKALKQCSKSLKAKCNFVRSVTKKLFGKAQKGTRKVRKEEGYTTLRDPLKTTIKDFKCKDYSKQEGTALTKAKFDALDTHFDTVYGQIKTMKTTADALVKASKEAKEAHKKALKDAKTAKSECEKKAEDDEKAAIATAKTNKETALTAAKAMKTDTDAEKTAKKEAEKKAHDDYKKAVKDAKEAEEAEDQKCDDLYDAAKETAKAALKASPGN